MLLPMLLYDSYYCHDSSYYYSRALTSLENLP